MIGCATAVLLALSPFAPQRVLFGPFQLGDLIVSADSADWLLDLLQKAGVSAEDAQEKMNDWKMYLLDYKVRRPDGRWTWYRPDRGGWGPKVLVEGQLTVELKDRKVRTVEIGLSACRPFGSHTDSSGIDAGISPHVATNVAITLRFDGLVVPSATGGITEYPERGHLSVRGFRYDVTGRCRIEKP